MMKPYGLMMHGQNNREVIFCQTQGKTLDEIEVFADDLIEAANKLKEHVAGKRQQG